MTAYYFSNVPYWLRSLNCWLVWKREIKPHQAKPTKVPYCARTGGAGSSTDSNTWSTFDEAVNTFERGGFDGIGIALTFPLAGADCDGCVDPVTGKGVDWGLEWVRKIDSYTEISPSGDGMRIFFQGSLPHPPTMPNEKRKTGIKRVIQGVMLEVYDSGRFLTFTGRHLEGTPKEVNERNAQGQEVYHWILDEDRKQKEAKQKAKPTQSPKHPHPQKESQTKPTSLTNNEIVPLALNAVGFV